MRLVIDGICFQRDSLQVVERFREIIPMFLTPKAIITILDRGNAFAPPGINAIPFPSYTGVATVADSLLIQEMCDHLKADAFISTGVTSPIRTPSLLFTGKPKEYSPQERVCKDQELSIVYARKIICLSHDFYLDLIKHYPEKAADVILLSQGSQDDVANVIFEAVKATIALGSSHAYLDFVRDWSALRTIQAAVDTAVYVDD